MTTVDKPRFVQCFGALAVSLRLHDDEIDEFQQGCYFSTLADLPIEAIEASVGVLQRQAGSYFPTTAEWYRVADDLAVSALVDVPNRPALPAVDERDETLTRIRAARDRLVAEWRSKPRTHGVDWGVLADRMATIQIRIPQPSYCDHCGDTGWVIKTCRDGDRCGHFDHADPDWGDEHSYAIRCGCLMHNPEIARRCAVSSQRQVKRTKTRESRQ